MKLLYQFNRWIEGWMPLVTPLSVLLGVLFSAWLVQWKFTVPWIFAFMTFSGSLGSGFQDMKRILLQPLPLLASLIILHLWMPLTAWGVGEALFHGDDLTRTGILLAFVIPTGIVSFMWVSMSRGNIALTLSIILVDTFLSPFIVPFSLRVFAGANVQIDAWGMMQGLILMVVLPSFIGMLLHQATDGRIKEQLGPKLAPFSKLGLIAVVSVNSSVAAPFFLHLSGKTIGIAAAILALASSGYAWGWWTARRLNGDRGIVVALTLNSGMRNISAGAVLATAYFPAGVVFPVIVGSLFQQLLASTYAYLLKRKYGSGELETH